MHVVVIGGSGNIGSATVRELSARGDQVRAVARRSPEVPASGLGSVEWVSADVSHDDLVPHLRGVDAVVHLAWKFQPTHQPQETWATNAVGTRRVLAACAAARVPAVVCASSIAAYSPAAHDRPVAEDWPTDGASEAAYCREKAYVERVLDAFELAHPEMRVVRIRPAFVFQRSASSEQRRIFAGSLVPARLFDRRLLPVVPLPRSLRVQSVHAEDLADGIATLVHGMASGAFNLAAPGLLGHEELGELLGARTVTVPDSVARVALDTAWRVRALPVPGSLLAGLLHLPVMGVDRASAELGWAPRHSAAEALEAVLTGIPERAGSQLPPLRP